MKSQHLTDIFPDATDEALMLRVRDHDCKQSYRRLFESWCQRVHRMCFRMTGCWQHSEDLTQDVFSKLYARRQSYVITAKFSTYIWHISINQCRDFARKSKTTERKHSELVQIHETRLSTYQNVEAKNIELANAVETALLELPFVYREVLVLRHYENLKFQQIADLLETPRGTIASRMAKALKLMSDRLDHHRMYRSGNKNLQQQSDPRHEE